MTIGGGTGSFTMLSELKTVAARLASIVAMTDSGGSSRRLMDEFGRPLPLGDLRQALVALSRSSRLWGDLFSYRFPEPEAGAASVVGGHSLGNLILHALEDLNHGDLLGAIEDAEELLNTAGHVIPVTLDRGTLCAELGDGTIVRGESAIDRAHERAVRPIRRVFVDPPIQATPRAVKALERADTILIGPGDLFTSVVPCLLAEGIPEADGPRFSVFEDAWVREHPRPTATLADVVAHVEHVREVAGIDHVGLGGDYDGVGTLPVGLEDVSTYPALLAALAERGWSTGDLARLTCRNTLRVMRDVEAVARDLQARRGPSLRTIEELDG